VILITAGIGLIASRLGFALLVAVMTVFTLRLIGREEMLLERDCGESYLEYRRRVPSMIPSITPRLPAAGARARWGQAVVGELSAWTNFTGMALYTCTLRQEALWIPVGVGLLFAAAHPLWRGKTARSSAGKSVRICSGLRRRAARSNACTWKSL
jgi:hypothetical protein